MDYVKGMRIGAWVGLLGTVVSVLLGSATPVDAECQNVTLSVPADRPRRVLLSNQTAIRNQGGRNTCTTFAAIAGLEAAYLRAGYTPLDLSEEFASYVGKMMWLHPIWRDITTPDSAETQVGAFGGGGAGGVIEWMVAAAFRVPLETAMPYRPGGYDLGGYAWDSDYWKSQRNQSDFNLIGSKPGVFANTNALPQAALEAGSYYSAGSCSRLSARNVEQLEAALAGGREIVWDSDTTLFGGAHAVLLIGYDKTNPANKYFIAKNSWGPTTNPGGYTYVPYSVVSAGGFDAVTVESIRSPRPWRELAAIGRWNLSFDGHHGSLDIYHLPGMSQMTFSKYGVSTPDRRVGTFYQTDGRAFRVNGRIAGNQITFYIDWNKPNLRWDELPATARVFTYRRARNTSTDRPVFAGYHVDADATRSTWGGYAIKARTPSEQSMWLSAVADPAGTWRPESFLGQWRINQGVLTFAMRDDSILLSTERGIVAGLRGTYRSDLDGRTTSVTGKVRIAEPRHLRAYNLVPSQTVEARKLSHERGVVAGTTFTDGVYMTRVR